MSKEQFSYYQILQLKKTASQQQVKQAYKRLALIHHPDKNEGKEQSMHKFRQISQAYTVCVVLNDPKKRDNYDKYGVADLEGIDIEDFMGSFGGFEEFLAEFLSFNTFEAMFSGMDKKKGKKSKARGRAKGRSKNNMSAKQMNQLTKLMMMGGMDMGGDDGMDPQIAMLQAMLAGGMIDPDDLDGMQKQLQKMILESDDGQGDDDDDQEDLTEEQMQILQFGQKNVEKKKVGKKKKKTELKCKFDGQKVQEDQILMHFSEKHMQQFKKWQKENKQSKENKGQQKQSKTKTDKQGTKTEKTEKKQQQQEIQY